RPPGSTLKPFLYAYAMQEDQLYPDEILLDAPMDRGLYNPRNFDEQYGGHVAAKDALRESLNIPALCLLSRVGIEAFHAHLQSIGFRNMDQPSDYYGLGLALGNAGAQLSELAAAYAILANDGVYREIRWEENAGDQPVRRIFSADIARQVSDMLSQALITDRSEIEVTERAIPTVSWKTGTSSGRHDAWAVLYDSHYVVAVWVGNNDYSPSTQLVGSEAALPVATRLYKILPQPDTPPHRRQIDFKTIPMCSASGLPANAECPAVRESTIPSSLHTLRRCDVHHKRPANDKSIAGPVEYWPAGPLGWDLAATPRDVKTVKAQTTKLNIIQPSDDARFIRTRARNGDRVQLASSLDDYHTIHWYLDGQFLGSSEPDKPLHLDLKPGEHRLSALTPKGESDQVTFEVVDPSGLQ
ncbi:MAG: penicillin-binding transpeptidase domain-containing protein, partial [Candidatus Sumerlaeota bacterium]